MKYVRNGARSYINKTKTNKKTAYEITKHASHIRMIIDSNDPTVSTKFDPSIFFVFVFMIIVITHYMPFTSVHLNATGNQTIHMKSYTTII